MDVGSDSRARLIAVCLVVILLVTAVGFGFDGLLRKEGFTRIDVLLASNGFTGIVAGLLFYSLSNQERERRKLVQQRLRTIADMNHHIRNALQVITYATAAETHANSVELIRSSVERIQWALREVLPGYEIANVTHEQVMPHEAAARASR